jgi:hypothetical protein
MLAVVGIDTVLVEHMTTLQHPLGIVNTLNLPGVADLVHAPVVGPTCHPPYDVEDRPRGKLI